LPAGFVAGLVARTDHDAYEAPVPQVIRQRVKQIRDNRSEAKAVA
jgi:hypothetical protein